jgi:hypothetical protein
MSVERMLPKPPSLFVIRGHHIKTLTQLFPPLSKTPEEIARKLRDDAVKDRGKINPRTVDWDILTRPDTSDKEYFPVYGYDLVGSTKAQADRFESSNVEIMKRFISLAGDAAIKLTAKELDPFCDGCAFANHCKTPSSFELDAQYLTVFEDVFAFAQDKDADFIEPMARTSDGDIETTARATCRVMSHFAISGLRAYDDAVLRREQHGSVFAGSGLADVEMYYNNFSQEIVSSLR